MDLKTKYSVDYEKFQNFLEREDKTTKLSAEEEEMNKIIN